TTNRCSDELCISGEISHNFIARCECVRVGMQEWEIGQPNRPVGKLKPEAVPSFRPPPFANPVPLNHDIRTTSLAKHMAHCQSGLATADNQGVDKLGPHGSLQPIISSSRWRARQQREYSELVADCIRTRGRQILESSRAGAADA